jgi:hypothetical protein
MTVVDEIKVVGAVRSSHATERFSLQTDGTYRADRTPMLAGMIACTRRWGQFLTLHSADIW